MSVKDILLEIVAGMFCIVVGAYFFWQEVVLKNITTSVGLFPGFMWEAAAVFGGLYVTLNGIRNLLNEILGR